MKKLLKYPLFALLGAVYAAFPVFLSRMLIMHLSDLFFKIGSLAALDADTLSYGVQILSPLRSAVIVSPWLIFLSSGAALALLWALIPCRHPVLRGILIVVLCILLLLPLVVCALWLASVNGIYIGALIQTLLPLLSQLI